MKSLDEQLAEFFALCPPVFLDGKHEADRCVAATFFLSGIASMAAECYLAVLNEGMANLAQVFKGLVAGAISEARRYGDLAVEHHNREVKDDPERGGDEAGRDPAAQPVVSPDDLLRGAGGPQPGVAPVGPGVGDRQSAEKPPGQV